MSHEVIIKLTNAEKAVLNVLFDDNKDVLSDKWNVHDFDEFVALLAVVGADHIKEILR